jgi:hypothetical protein
LSLDALLILLEHGLAHRASQPCQVFRAQQDEAVLEERMSKVSRESDMEAQLRGSEDGDRRALEQGLIDVLTQRFPYVSINDAALFPLMMNTGHSSSVHAMRRRPTPTEVHHVFCRRKPIKAHDAI